MENPHLPPRPRGRVVLSTGWVLARSIPHDAGDSVGGGAEVTNASLRPIGDGALQAFPSGGSRRRSTVCV